MGWRWCSVGVGLALLLAGCAPFGSSPQQRLGELTVQVPPLQRAITLSDGRYSAGGVQARLLRVEGGELGGDRGRDAVGVLEVIVPGKGLHYLLLAAVEQAGQRRASSIYLGAHLKLEELRIEEHTALLQLKRPQPGDLPCCPSLALTERYRWQDDRLREMAPSLVDTRWEVVELWGRPLRVRKAARPHLTFGANSRAQAFGGCNELAVGYRINGATLRLDGVGGGTRYCADTPEEDFIGALIQIDRYRQQGATLELYSGDEVLARLRAAP